MSVTPSETTAPSGFCINCKQTKPADAFNVDRQRASGRCAYCRVCVNVRKHERGHTAKNKERQRDRYRANHNGYRDRTLAAARSRTPDKKREYDLRSHYRMTMSEFDALLAAQHGVCAICMELPRTRMDKPARGWHVDHDHRTGTIRGILCGPCNTALGQFRDSIETLTSAISYLKRGSIVD